MFTRKSSASIWCDGYGNEENNGGNIFSIKSAMNFGTNPWDEFSSPPKKSHRMAELANAQTINQRDDGFFSTLDRDDVIPFSKNYEQKSTTCKTLVGNATSSKNDTQPDQIKKKFMLDELDEEDRKQPERDFRNFEQFRRELECTLNSKQGGYSNAAHLARDFAEDTGVEPSKVAYQFGFASFETLLKSNMLKSTVRVEADENGRARFFPRENSRYDHIREAQTISQADMQCRNDKKERERLGRAWLPEYRQKALEGKMRLVNVAEELGAEKRYVEFREIQDGYLRKYDTVLNKEETKRLFDHSSISKVFSTICADEFEVNEEESYSGYVYVKLRRPVDDLREIHAKCLEDLANGVSTTKKPKSKKAKVPLSQRELTFQPILAPIVDSRMNAD